MALLLRQALGAPLWGGSQALARLGVITQQQQQQQLGPGGLLGCTDNIFSSQRQQEDGQKQSNANALALRHFAASAKAQELKLTLGGVAGSFRLGSDATTRLARLPLGLGTCSAGGLLGAPLSVRRLNAWSPAQRYFVEGDHVISAEANRTIQFTGLDAGSFYPFVIYTAFASVVASVFVILPFLVAPTRVDLDKSSAYECGFDAFGEARQTFSVSFYLVSIMYLLFDIEIAYLFPYVMTHANAPMFWTMNLFLGILVAGFVYEWGVGALEWRESQAH